MHPIDLLGYSDFDKSKIYLKNIRYKLIETNNLDLSNEIKKIISQGILLRTIILEENVINIFPLLEEGNSVNHYNISKLITHLNSLYLHIRGYLDNLAYITAIFFNFLDLLKKSSLLSISLQSNKFQNHLKSKSIEFWTEVNTKADWLRNLKMLRDPIAHGLPLYVAPLYVSEEDINEFNRFNTERNNKIIQAIKENDLESAFEYIHKNPPVGKFEPIMYREDQRRIYKLDLLIENDLKSLQEITNSFTKVLGLQTSLN